MRTLSEWTSVLGAAGGLVWPSSQEATTNAADNIASPQVLPRASRMSRKDSKIIASVSRPA
jgi:hypothetical protein